MTAQWRAVTSVSIWDSTRAPEFTTEFRPQQISPSALESLRGIQAFRQTLDAYLYHEPPDAPPHPPKDFGGRRS